MPATADADGTTIGAGNDRVQAVARGLAWATSFVACVALPVVMVVANKSAPVALGLAAVLANLAVVCSSGSTVLVRRYRSTLATGTACAASILTGLSLISLAWTIDPSITQRGLIEATPELAFGWGLAAAWPVVVQRRDLRLLVPGLLAAALLVALEARLGMRLHHLAGARAASYDLKRSVIPLAMLLWPTVALWSGRQPLWLSGLLVVAVAAAALFAHSAASFVAVLLGVVALFTARALPRLTLKIVTAGGLLLLVLTPWTGTLAGLILSPQAEQVLSDQHASHRVQIWTAFERHIRDKHLIGHGFDTSFRIADVVETGGVSTDPISDRAIDRIHPHNVLLQVWIEFGVLGAAFVGVAIIFIAARLSTLPAWPRACRLAFLISVATVALVGLNAWSPWWLAVLAVCLTIFRIDHDLTHSPARTGGGRAPINTDRRDAVQ